MPSEENEGAKPLVVLGQISTSWTCVRDPVKFIMTYGPAIRKYLLALLRNEHDAEEVLQDLLLQVTEKGFVRASPDRGRFRVFRLVP